MPAAGSLWGKVGTVTNSKGPVVYEIDDQPAVEFYKRYLGKHVAPRGENPLAVFEENHENYYLRAPMGYKMDEGSITFSADVPEGSIIQVTSAQRNDIIDASTSSIKQALNSYPGENPVVAVLISCAARKHLLGTKTELELLQFRQHVEAEFPICGFYSYGEISPFQSNTPTHYHNETLVTLLIGQ